MSLPSTNSYPSYMTLSEYVQHQKNGANFRAVRRSRNAACARQRTLGQTVWMYSIVKRLRIRSARRPDREIYADPGAAGQLTMCSVDTWHELKLFAVGTDARPEPVIPVLFEPVLISMHGNQMLFRGLERQGNQRDPSAVSTLQEWSVQITMGQPAEVAQQPHRAPS